MFLTNIFHIKSIESYECFFFALQLIVKLRRVSTDLKVPASGISPTAPVIYLYISTQLTGELC